MTTASGVITMTHDSAESLTHATAATLQSLQAVSLDELNAVAALQTRLDRKYVLLGDDLNGVLAEIAAGDQAVLQIDGRRDFGYSSTYFDTPELTCFTDHRQGRRHRFKVRTRIYRDSGQCMLEVKRSGRRGETVKTRAAYQLPDAGRLTDGAREFAARALDGDPRVRRLDAVLRTDYRRVTLLDATAGSRVTIDLGLTFEVPSNGIGPGGSAELTGLNPGPNTVPSTPRAVPIGPGTAPIQPTTVPTGPSVVRTGSVVIETKSAGGNSRVDAVLRALGYRPVSISKYCVGIALTRPQLSANRWLRVLRRHFAADA